MTVVRASCTKTGDQAGRRPAPVVVVAGARFLRLARALRDDPGERAKVAVTAASDVVLRTLGASLVATPAMPLGYHPRVLLARSD